MKNLLAETVTLLCKNGLSFQEEMRIEALIGITIDRNDVFLVHINEKLDTRESISQVNALETLPENVHVSLNKELNPKDSLPPTKRKGARDGRRGGARRGGRRQNRNFAAKNLEVNNSVDKSVVDVDHANNVVQEAIITDVDSVQFTPEQMNVKTEPPDIEKDNVLAVSDTTVKIEVPSNSDDDASAMRRTYSSMQNASLDNLGNSFEEQLTPPRKKRNISTTSSDTNHDSNSPFIPAFAKTLASDEESQGLMPVTAWPNIASISDIGDGTPGCSAWATPGSTPAKTGQGSESVSTTFCV